MDPRIDDRASEESGRRVLLEPKFNTRRAGALLSSFAAALIVSFSLLGWVVETLFPAQKAASDLSVARALSEWVADSCSLSGTARVVTELGSTAFTLPAALAFGLLWRRIKGGWDPLIFLAVAILGSTLVQAAIKLLIGRPRPLLERLAPATGFSFPSGHATRAIVLYVGVAFLASRAAASPTARLMMWTFAFTLALAVAVSRVMVGVHYGTDVVAGLMLGGLWLLATRRALEPRGFG